MDLPREFLNNRYQQLWDAAFEPVCQGDIIIDPLLARREVDLRQCLTVLVRPSMAVQATVAAFLQELRVFEPGQYYYKAEELHVTVLSLFTATLEYEKKFRHYDRYLEAVNAALAVVPTFSLEFTGVTLTREAVMIQGFFGDTILNDIREALRKELRARDLTDGLDSRYVLQTAHMTAVRFRESLSGSHKFAQILEQFRQHNFGHTRVTELQLVRNDWYMSTSSVEVLRRFSTKGT